MNVLVDTLPPTADVYRCSYGHDGSGWGVWGVGPAGPATPRGGGQLGAAFLPPLAPASGCLWGWRELISPGCRFVLLHGCLWGHSSMSMCLHSYLCVSLCLHVLLVVPQLGRYLGRGVGRGR